MKSILLLILIFFASFVMVILGLVSSAMWRDLIASASAIILFIAGVASFVDTNETMKSIPLFFASYVMVALGFIPFAMLRDLIAFTSAIILFIVGVTFLVDTFPRNNLRSNGRTTHKR